MKSAPLKKTPHCAAPYFRGLFASLVLLCLLAASSPAQLEGTKIAFWSGRDRNSEIYVMDADGKNIIRLTKNRQHDRRPTWSPDGALIAFDSNRTGGNFEIYVMNPPTEKTSSTSPTPQQQPTALLPGHRTERRLPLSQTAIAIRKSM